MSTLSEKEVLREAMRTDKIEWECRPGDSSAILTMGEISTCLH